MASPWYTVYIHELAVAVGARQLDSVVQLVRALHWNRRAVDSIPARAYSCIFHKCSWYKITHLSAKITHHF